MKPGQPIVVSAVRGVDYDWAYTDQTQTRIWIQVLPGSLVPLNYVRITALIDDGMGGVSEYTYFDVMTARNGSTWKRPKRRRWPCSCAARTAPPYRAIR